MRFRGSFGKMFVLLYEFCICVGEILLRRSTFVSLGLGNFSSVLSSRKILFVASAGAKLGTWSLAECACGRHFPGIPLPVFPPIGQSLNAPLICAAFAAALGPNLQAAMSR